MKKVITMLLGLVLLGSPVIAQRIPVEGWYKWSLLSTVKAGRIQEKEPTFTPLNVLEKFQFLEKVSVSKEIVKVNLV